VRDIGLGQIPLTSSTLTVPGEPNTPRQDSQKAATAEQQAAGAPPNPQRRDIISLSSATAPAAYDARDTYQGQTACKAFDVLDQGGCGACYAFAAASAFSARMCRAFPGSLGNVVVSPQQLVDCTTGCAGGNEFVALQSLVYRPNVEAWCDPYSGTQGTCGSVCGTGNAYAAVPGTVRVVGGAGAAGVLQMQLELLRGGPGVVSFLAMSDFWYYGGGVYVPSSGATVVGGHAVSLVGWGVDSGVPYWVCQNSWGPGFGEGGYFRILRGADACAIESRSGLVVATPAPPAFSVCPNATCASGSVTLRDCTCRCDNGLAGPTCSDCPLVCRNGGARDAACTVCTCPLGFSGPQCEGGYATASPLAFCDADASSATLTWTYSFSPAAPAPTQTSFVGVYPLDATSPSQALSQAAVCGSAYPAYNSSANGGLCPATGTVSLVRPTAAGQYKVVAVPWSPGGSSDAQGYYPPLQDSAIIARITVLPSADCTVASLAAAFAANDPSAEVSAALSGEAWTLAVMQVRLDASQQMVQALQMELPASLAITGLPVAASPLPRLWLGTPQQLCYTIPPSANVNPKGLVLFAGDASGGLTSYYVNALGAGALPAAGQACVNITVSSGVPPGRYTVVLQDSTTQNPMATVSFDAGLGTVAFASVYPYATYIAMTIRWKVGAAHASPRDIVRLFNSAGTVVFWAYTSCNCQTAPGAAAVPSGTVSVVVQKAGAVPGGYTPRLYPGGGSMAAQTLASSFPWTAFGY
jgi:cathepsin B